MKIQPTARVIIPLAFVIGLAACTLVVGSPGNPPTDIATPLATPTAYSSQSPATDTATAPTPAYTATVASTATPTPAAATATPAIIASQTPAILASATPTPLWTPLPPGDIHWIQPAGPYTATVGLYPHQWRVVDAGNLNLRAGPGVQFPIVDTLARNEIAGGVESAAGWVQIADRRGAAGYASARYLTDPPCDPGSIMGSAPAGFLVHVVSLFTTPGLAYPAAGGDITITPGLGPTGHEFSEPFPGGLYLIQLIDANVRPLGDPVQILLECEHPAAVVVWK